MEAHILHHLARLIGLGEIMDRQHAQGIIAPILRRRHGRSLILLGGQGCWRLVRLAEQQGVAGVLLEPILLGDFVRLEISGPPAPNRADAARQDRARVG
jgi:hypothetical protein